MQEPYKNQARTEKKYTKSEDISYGKKNTRLGGWVRVGPGVLAKAKKIIVSVGTISTFCHPLVKYVGQSSIGCYA